MSERVGIGGEIKTRCRMSAENIRERIKETLSKYRSSTEEVMIDAEIYQESTKRTFVGVLDPRECTEGDCTSAILLLLRLMATENGWRGRKYMGYVLAAVSETAFMDVSEWHKKTEEC
jgi:hypothetical protein